MPRPTWRVRFDVPHNFAVLPGFVQAIHAHDLRPLPGALLGTWRDDNTGLILLSPSFATEAWYDSALWRPLAAWNKQAAFWDAARRANVENVSALSQLMSSVRPAILAGQTIGYVGGVGAGITGQLLLRLRPIKPDDKLVWTLESTISTARDEGYVFHYRVHGDELHRYANIVAILVGDIGLHLSGDGIMRALKYDIANMTAAPTIIDEFQLCSPGDIANKDNYLFVIPIPGYGLSIYHNLSPQILGGRRSSAVSGATRGHLVQIYRKDGAGPFVHSGGKIYIGHLPETELTTVRYTFGFHSVRYSTANTPAFTSPIFDPGFKPTASPSQLTGITVPTSFTASFTVTATLRNAADSAAWVSGTDRQGRVRVTMSTTDARYSPMLLGTFVQWTPVIATRNTTPVIVYPDRGEAIGDLRVDAATHLEWTTDDTARMEGVTEVVAESPALRAIVERGDTTFVIERCDDPDAATPVWVLEPECGGFALVDGDPTYHQTPAAGGGWYGFYRAKFKLVGMRHRFSEVHQTIRTAFDNLTIAASIDTLLVGASQPPALEMDSDLGMIQLPGTPQGQNWRYGTSPGDSGEEILTQLLLFGRKQNVEHIARYDWAGNGWRFVKKPRNMAAGSTWTFTTFEDERAGARTIYIDDAFSFRPTPPEVNLLQPIGVSSTDASSAEQVPGAPLVLPGSLTDPSRRDYLGRVKYAQALFAPVSDLGGPIGVNAMGRRVFAQVCRWTVNIRCAGVDYVAAAVPGLYIGALRGMGPGDVASGGGGGVAGGARASLFTQLWIKRRTVVLQKGSGGPVAPSVLYALSNRWESDLDE